jgi:acyl-CoA reductase-like NAD-dependent aldehyde dehydrogenase
MTDLMATPAASLAPPLPGWTLELSITGAPVMGRAEPVPVSDPATERVLARVPQADAEQVEHAVVAARRAFESGPWPSMSGQERSDLLFALADGLEQRADELAAGVTFETGTPITESRIARWSCRSRCFAGTPSLPATTGRSTSGPTTTRCPATAWSPTARLGS